MTNDEYQLGRNGHEVRTCPLAWVTGAASGIGRAIALALASLRYRLILMDRDAQGLALTQRMGATPANSICVDLNDLEKLAHVLSEALTRDGAPSVIINCAAEGVYESFMDQSPAMRERLMAVNHEAPVRIIQAALPGMMGLAAAGGMVHVMNICSCSARMGAWGHGAYAASKGAMRAMTETLAAEFGPQGIRFTLVYPGIVQTPYFSHSGMERLWPLVKRRAIQPERVASAVVRGLGRAGLELYVPWHYRVLELMIAVSPNAALSMVRGQSSPRAQIRSSVHGPQNDLKLGSADNR